MARASIEVHHYHHFASDTDTAQTLARIEQKLAQILTQGAEMATDLSALQTEVAENGDVVASASALLARLADEIRNAGTDQAALNALAANLDVNNAALSAAVAANTPADPGGEVPPVEPPPA